MNDLNYKGAEMQYLRKELFKLNREIQKNQIENAKLNRDSPGEFWEAVSKHNSIEEYFIERDRLEALKGDDKQ